MLMKKSLLSCLAIAACAGYALAADPTLYVGAKFQHLSANGNVAVSEVMGTLTIYDLKAGTSVSFGATEDDDDFTYSTDYTLGNGNCVTADGSIILVSINYDKAAYLQNGEFYDLDVPNPDLTNSFNGITPDGARICGNVGSASMNEGFDSDVTMCLPAYWDRNADGKGYGKCNLLPAPKTDLFGRAPQYVKAIAISKDGKTIAGQITDARGMYEYPIVYKQDNDGKWSYILPSEKLFNPDKLPMPGNEPVSPVSPNPTDYMSGDRKTAYQEAYDRYEWPNAEDYMTDAEKAEYQKAVDKYNAENEIWWNEWDEWNSKYFDITESSPNFFDNNIFLSTDGKKVVSTVSSLVENPNPTGWGSPFMEVYSPCTVDIESGDFWTVDPEISCYVSGVADNGIIFATNEPGSIPMSGYIIKDGDIQTIQAYLTSVNPDYGKWITKNMSHEIINYVWSDETEQYEEVPEEVTYTGVPVATPDMSLLSIWNDRGWDDSYEYFGESVIFELSATGGISSISADNKNLSVDENGNINVPAGFASVKVYNISGACVKDVNAPAATIELSLEKGVYVVKGIRNDGSVSIIKISK